MGFSFNNVHSDNYNIKVRSYNKDILPKIETKKFDGSFNGSYFLYKNLGLREITIRCIFIAQNDVQFESTLRNIALWLDKSKPCKLVLDEETDRYYNAVVTNTKVNQELNLGEIDITFTCFDPYAYSNNKTTITTTGNKTITNNYSEVYPILNFNLDKDMTSFFISNNGYKFEAIGSFKSGDKIKIDMNTGRFERNLILENKALTLESEFFKLSNGLNGILTNLTCVITWEYTQRFI